MFQAKQLISSLGLMEARRIARNKAERVCVDAAWSIQEIADSDEIIYTSRAVTSLPHKSGGHIDNWEQDSGDGCYRWCAPQPQGGLPFGSKSRMILIHLLHTAIANGNPQVMCGDTLYKWNARIQNTSVGGMTYRIILDHAWRVLRSELSVENATGDGAIDFGHIAFAEDVNKSNVPTTIRLSDAFYDHICKNTVPVCYSALQLIKNNSSAIDLYIRLSDGLPKLKSTRLATWAELKRRFGAGYKNIRQMKPAFLDTLSLVSAVYPQARIETREEGVLLYPSPSSVDHLLQQEQPKLFAAG